MFTSKRKGLIFLICATMRNFLMIKYVSRMATQAKLAEGSKKIMMEKTRGRVHLCTNESTDEIEALIGKKTLPGIFFKILHQKNLSVSLKSVTYTHSIVHLTNVLVERSLTQKSTYYMIPFI